MSDGDDNMCLSLTKPFRIIHARFFPLQPSLPQRFDFWWQHRQYRHNQDDHKQLAHPNVRVKVAISHGGESDHDKIEAVEQVEMSWAGSLQVFHATRAGEDETNQRGE